MPDAREYLKAQLAVLKGQRDAAQKQAWMDERLAAESRDNFVRLDAIFTFLNRLIRNLEKTVPVKNVSSGKVPIKSMFKPGKDANGAQHS